PDRRAVGFRTLGCHGAAVARAARAARPARGHLRLLHPLLHIAGRSLARARVPLHPPRLGPSHGARILPRAAGRRAGALLRRVPAPPRAHVRPAHPLRTRPRRLHRASLAVARRDHRSLRRRPVRPRRARPHHPARGRARLTHARRRTANAARPLHRVRRRGAPPSASTVTAPPASMSSRAASRVSTSRTSPLPVSSVTSCALTPSSTIAPASVSAL